MNARRTVHIYSQYLWPDDAPTGIYAEQVADAVGAAGVPVRLVGGQGIYREGRRTPPKTAIDRVSHFVGRRGALVSTAREYESVRRAFAADISARVRPDDVVVVTSAPPTTVFLERAISRRGAIGVYWLQDYYPELIRGVWDAPASAREVFSAYWKRSLRRWHRVVKAGGNLGYTGSNALVIRNWNTLELGAPQPFRPRTALYSGNLGYGHDVPSFVALCQTLRAEGVEILVQGDGPGMRHLPGWIRVAEPRVDPRDLIRAYWEAEMHLVAGHPKITTGIFPSKFWNAHATGRPVLASGFAGPMATELEHARACDPRLHLPHWKNFLLELADASAQVARL